ncbi:MAG: M23 family metallopeptidase [Candidatus Paceibacterota bacterium]
MALLKAATNANPALAQGGSDVAVISGSALLAETGPSGTIANIGDFQPEQGSISTYVVREGDSLSEIATMFNVSQNTILWANDLSRTSVIKPGQQLIILPVTGVRHMIAKGDTLESISKKYKADIDEIRGFNAISSDTVLAIGEVLIIPEGEVSISAYTPSVAVKEKSTAEYVGYFTHPVPTALKTQGLHGYNAVDFGAPQGTPIYASASGEVVVARSGGWNGGFGSYVVIKHPNGAQTLYAHQSSVLVNSGDWVVKGERIGSVGSTGRSTGPHLHFEVRGAKNPFSSCALMSRCGY